MSTRAPAVEESGAAIWGAAFGYFASYAPYSALTNALSHGVFPGQRRFSGLELLPVSAGASLVGMFIFLTAMRWWKHAGHRNLFGLSVPSPGLWTFLSGLCSAAIILTTTLAYTFEGVSILFMMVLMRGGVLVLAPVVDLISGRKVRWFSAVALVLSLGAVLVNLVENKSYHLSVVALIDVGVYLAAYFVRMRLMSRLAKSDSKAAGLRYFVEEQMVATPAAVFFLIALAAGGPAFGVVGDGVRAGFAVIAGPAAPWVLLIGVFSQGTGIFGALILLDKRENSFCMPVNRASSVLAGVLATYALAWWLGQPHPDASELISAALLIGAILVLSLPAVFGKKAAKP